MRVVPSEAEVSNAIAIAAILMFSFSVVPMMIRYAVFTEIMRATYHVLVFCRVPAEILTAPFQVAGLEDSVYLHFFRRPAAGDGAWPVPMLTHFLYVTVLQVLVALGLKENSKILEMALKLTATYPYYWCVSFNELVQISLLTAYAGHVIYERIYATSRDGAVKVGSWYTCGITEKIKAFFMWDIVTAMYAKLGEDAVLLEPFFLGWEMMGIWWNVSNFLPYIFAGVMDLMFESVFQVFRCAMSVVGFLGLRPVSEVHPMEDRSMEIYQEVNSMKVSMNADATNLEAPTLEIYQEVHSMKVSMNVDSMIVESMEAQTLETYQDYKPEVPKALEIVQVNTAETPRKPPQTHRYGPYTPGTKAYHLRKLDFLSRPALAGTLATQIRLAKFYDGALLHKELLRVSEHAGWAHRAAFEKALPKVRSFKHSNEFMRWFLTWKLPAAAAKIFFLGQTDRVLFLEKAQNYEEALEIFRVLDRLPYIHLDFADTFHQLVTDGPLSHPPIAEALIGIYTLFPSYFRFIHALDRTWWVSSAKVEGHPPYRLRRYAFLKPSIKSGRSKPGWQTKGENFDVNKVAKPRTDVMLDWSLILAYPGNKTAIAKWDSKSWYSTISPQLLTDLGLTPRCTGNMSMLYGIGPMVEEKKVFIHFRMPGVASVSESFSFEFLVLSDMKYPMVLGEDFRLKNFIYCEDGNHMTSSSAVIPKLSNYVLSRWLKNDSYNSDH